MTSRPRAGGTDTQFATTRDRDANAETVRQREPDMVAKAPGGAKRFFFLHRARRLFFLTRQKEQGGCKNAPFLCEENYQQKSQEKFKNISIL